MNFQYKVRDPSGRILSNFEEASSRSNLLKSLSDRGLRPIAVVPAEAKSATPSSLRTQAAPSGKSILSTSIGGSVKPQEVVFFTRDLYTLIHSGTPLISGLQDICEQTKNVFFASVLRAILQDIESGGKLSESLEKHGKIFSEVYTSSVRVGEQTGRLEQVLKRLIEVMERDIETSMTVTNALRYPSIVIGFIGLAFGVIVVVVIPKIAAIYRTLKSDLPLPTRIIIGIGEFSQDHWFLVLITLIGSFVLFQIWKRTKSGKLIWDLVLLKIPVFGTLVSKAAISKFASTLQTLHESGLVIPEALKLSARVVGNEVISRGILQAQEEVTRGKMLSEVLRQNKFFPPLVVRMISMGERTGNLDEMLGEVVHYYDREIQYLTKSMTTLIEPIVTVALGGMILVLALGVFLPMWNMYGLLTH